MSVGAKVGNLGRELFSDFVLFLQSRFVPRAPLRGKVEKPFQESWSRIDLGILYPSSHYYLRSLSWTSRTFYFPDSRDLLEVLGGLSWQRARGGSLGDRPGP